MVALINDGSKDSICSNMNEFLARHLETAAAQYEKIVFESDAAFNKPAPGPEVSFAIGGVSVVNSYFDHTQNTVFIEMPPSHEPHLSRVLFVLRLGTCDYRILFMVLACGRAQEKIG